jgi:hypothetical protein
LAQAQPSSRLTLVLEQEIEQRLIDLVGHSLTSLGAAYGLAACVIEYSLVA